MKKTTRILIVDHRQDNLTAARQALELAGFETFVAQNGETGLQFAQAHQPDLVFLNLPLPDIDGYQVCQQIKADPRLSSLFVVIIFDSSEECGNWKERADEAGADEFFAQPTSPNELVERVRLLARLKSTEKALRQSEERLKQVTQIARLGIWEWDLVTDQTTWNSEMFRLFGVDPNHFSGNAAEFRRFAREDNQGILQDNVQRVIERGITEAELLAGNLPESEIKELCIVRPDGMERYTLGDAICILDDHHQPVRLLGVNWDHTEQRQIEHALRENERFNRLMIEHSPIGIAVRNRQGQLIQYNDAWVKMMGVNEDQITGHRQEINQGDFRKMAAHLGPHVEKIKNIFIDHQPVFIPELQIQNTETPRWVSQYFYPLESANGEVDQIVVLTVDITERKLAEQLLRNSAAKYQAIFEENPVGILMLDEQGSVIEWNRTMERISGIPRQDAIGEKTWDMQYRLTLPEKKTQDLYNQYKSNVQQVLQTGQTPTMLHPGHPYETVVQSIDGRLVHIQQVSFSIKTETGFHLASLIYDVTELKQSEDALKKQHETLQGIIESTKEVVFSIDREYRYTSFNRSHALGMKILYGADIEIGHPLFEYMTVPEDWATAKKNIDRALAGEQFIESSYTGDQALARIYVEVSHNPIKSTDGEVIGVSVFANDISYRVQAEETLRKSEKQYRLLAENSSDMISLHNLEGAYVYVSPACQELLGYHPEEFVGRSAYEFIYPDDEAIVRSSHIQVLQQESVTTLQYRMLCKDGHAIWVETSCQLYRDPQTGSASEIQCVTRDIRERKRAEGELRRRSALTEALARVANRLNAELDLDMVLQVVCDEALNSLHTPGACVFLCDEARQEMTLAGVSGFSRQYIQGYVPFSLALYHQYIKELGITYVTPDIQAEIGFKNQELFRQLGIHTVAIAGMLRDGKIIGALAVLTQEQSYRFTEDELLLLKGLADESALAIANARLFRDVQMELVERTEAENALKTSKEFAENLIETANAIVIQLDISGNVRVFNQAAEKITGYSRAEVLDHNWDLIVPRDRYPQVWEKFSGLGAGNLPKNYENQILTKSSEERFIVWQNNELYEHGALVGSLSFGMDITERKQAEAQNQRRMVELQAIYESGLALTFSLEPKEIGHKVIDALTQKLHWHHAVVREYHADRNWIEILAMSHQGMSLAEIQQEITRLQRLISQAGQGLSGWVIAHGESILCNDLSKDPRYIPSYPDIHSGMYVPIQVAQATIGCITAESDQLNAFDEHDLRLLKTIAVQAGIALQNAHLYQALELDLKERRRVEQELQVLNERLEHRVGERTEELHRVNAELERASRLKDEFLASMSHELRTPLTGVLSLSEAMQEQVYGPLNEKQMHTLRSIEHSGRHLLGLINDILDLSKIEAGQLELQMETCSVADICQASLQMVKGLAQKRRQNISFTTNPAAIILHADPRRLKQMLVNLLSNAVKYTPEGGMIGLQVEVDSATQMVRFTVWDNGIGIAAEDLPRLFQPFTQLDSRLSRQQSGTGLGLALVRRMAEMHGGEVTVESAPGRGSRFTIRLPWQDFPRQDIADSHQSGTGSLGSRPNSEIPLSESRVVDRGPLILLVDDNEVNLSTYSDYLQAKGYRVLLARSGLEAIQVAERERPHLILMDIQMPDTDGLQAIQGIRARNNPILANTPVIALTALAMPGDKDRCLAAGADDYLSKPVTLKNLVQAIEANLRKGREIPPSND